MDKMTNNEIWQAVLGEIELSVSPANFVTWFKNTSIISISQGKVNIRVPNGFAKEWLENKYNRYILNALRNFIKDVREISCSVVAVAPEEATPKVVDSAASTSPAAQPGPIHQKISHESLSLRANLNPRYTFDSFVVGANNELAHAACEAIAKNPGNAYNPLFIYGGVGLGKTHLLQSVGNALLAENPDTKIIYATAEYFTNQYVDMVKNKQAHEFKRAYLDSDLLLIDDIQFIGGKEKTQEEFFHVFNTLHQTGKQIVLTSDRPPKAIAMLEERLRSRFEGGMIADVSRPDVETRIAILQNKLVEKKVSLEIGNEVLSYIASNIQHNIRELEGALNRVIAACELNQSEPNLTNVKKILGDIIHSGKKKGVNFKQIIQAVAEYYDIATSDLVNRCRRRDIVKPRQIAMYLMRSELQASYPGIGEQLGGRDHTTAMHAFEKISKELEKEESLEQEINIIKSKIYSE
ncbi:MAG: chromosomal replication initiator protein DnaA [Candidatus Moranbacteria bacterium]|nr:chromosomal replication initiator protein DnaA [Candidatus Moranbacteria bacterium]